MPSESKKVRGKGKISSLTSLLLPFLQCNATFFYISNRMERKEKNKLLEIIALFCFDHIRREFL